MKKSWQDLGREWLDTLVVAISVAMAFRAYFYEPFNIPTGSMQPTLYGNHSEPCAQPGPVQRTPLKWLEWLITGRHYKELTAPFAGTPHFRRRIDGRFDVAIVSRTGRVSGTTSLPTDALGAFDFGPRYAGCELRPRETGADRFTLTALRPGGAAEDVQVEAGRRLWSGYDTTGDFIFVNRWIWNFRKPRRGDVMVFATTGIDGLMQGTHYIKRLTALPGETVEIAGGKVLVDGRETGPLKPERGARGEPMPLPNPGRMKGAVKLGDDGFFACGDNSDNSYDSRYWGSVPRANLRGTGACVFWPLANPRWGSIK